MIAARTFLLISTVVSLLAQPCLAAGRGFPGAGGDYGGAIEAEDSTPDAEIAAASGAARVILSNAGSATVNLVWRNQTYAFKSRFLRDAPGDEIHGTLSRTVARKGREGGETPESLQIVLKLTADVRKIDGTLTEQPEGGSPGSPVEFALSGAVADPLLLQQLEPGIRTSFINPPSTTTPSEAAAGMSSEPPVEAEGFAVISLGNTNRRNGRFIGRLPDNEKFSSGSPLRSTSYVVRSPLYKGGARVTPGGQVLGNATAAASSMAPHETRGISGTAADLLAALRWHKRRQHPGSPPYNAYSGGFDHRLQLDGREYRFPAGADRRLVPIGLNTSGPRSEANATITMTNGNFDGVVQVPVNITIFGVRILSPNPIGLKMAVNARKGQFSGSFKHPAHPPGARRVAFSGAFQSPQGFTPGEGRGNFLSVPDRNDASKSRSGTVQVKPAF